VTCIRWRPVLDRAQEIVESYDVLIDPRQLFYRLVAERPLPNTTYHYKQLSRATAEGRREGTFPDLIDTPRWIHRPQTFSSPEQAQAWLRALYRRDRTENQDTSVYLGVEKRRVLAQLETWFGEHGVPVLPLGGYASQSFVDEVREDIVRDGRRTVMLYAGDFDSSGEDIDPDFIERVGIFDEVVRVALMPEQVADYDLPAQMGKASDSRSKAFVERHGTLVQVDLEALDPTILRGLYEDALAPYWDVSEFERSWEQEAADLDVLPRLD
jgi:hypothetical protein